MSDAQRGIEDPPLAQEGLSQFTARILNQLSLSAWLPAAAFVGLLLIIGSLRAANGNFEVAMGHLGDLSIEGFALLVSGAVLATMLTQAFQFEAIQLLEGYWGPRRLPSWCADRRAGKHLRKRDALQAELEDVRRCAWSVARLSILDGQRFDEETVATVDRLLMRRGGVKALSEDARLLRREWRDYIPLRQRRRMDSLSAALDRYPKQGNLIQPTRFGNTLRAYEEKVHAKIGPDPLESLVQKTWHTLPLNVQRSHDQLRGRLDLYCTLSVVLVLCAATGVIALSGLGLALPTGAAGLGLLGAWLAYRAAATSARAYGTVLVVIADLVAPKAT